MDWNIVVLIAGIATLLIAVLIVVFRALRSHASEAAEKKRVSKILHTFALPRGFKVLDNATLVSDGLSGWADHILIGHFGILLVYDLCWGGQYFGDLNEDKWSLAVKDKGTAKIDNPLRAAAKCTGRINTLLKSARLKVNVDTAVIITGISKDTISYIKSDSVIRVKTLRSYLKKSKFDQDRDVDVNVVTTLLSGALK